MTHHCLAKQHKAVENTAQCSTSPPVLALPPLSDRGSGTLLMALDALTEAPVLLVAGPSCPSGRGQLEARGKESAGR